MVDDIDDFLPTPRLRQTDGEQVRGHGLHSRPRELFGRSQGVAEYDRGRCQFSEVRELYSVDHGCEESRVARMVTREVECSADRVPPVGEVARDEQLETQLCGDHDSIFR